MFCIECGTQLPDTAKFCAGCGTRLSVTPAPATSAPSRPAGAPSGPFFSSAEQPSDAAQGPPLSAGNELLGRFRIERLLGVGGFGAVYLAQDGQRGEPVALKVVIVRAGHATAAVEQLRHELRLRDRITNFTHVLRTYDLHTAEWKGLSLLLLPMEYATGGSLRNWLSQHRADVERRRTGGVELFKQACLGVQALHAAGLVHLDLKPENLLLCRGAKGETVVKVTDFGLSRNVEQYSMNPAAVLQAGAGTPTYQSPEQFRAARQEDIGPESDVYSLGIILFEILDKHGKPPFDGTAAELREKHLTLKPPSLSEVSASLASVALGALAKEPRERPALAELLLGEVATGAASTRPKNRLVKSSISTRELEKLVGVKLRGKVITKVLMPSLSEAMASGESTGKVIRWLKSEGDWVAGGDCIAEVETDKADVEMEAFGRGFLHILVPAGETAPAGTLLALLVDDGRAS